MEQEIASAVQELLQEVSEEGNESSYGMRSNISRVVSFSEAGLMTHDQGLVLTFEDGREYQITVVRSR